VRGLAGQMRHPKSKSGREQALRVRPVRRQRIARRPSCTTRCGMRWHVSCVCCQKTVCACALSLVLYCVVCWQRNVFGSGWAPLLLGFLMFLFCSVKFARSCLRLLHAVRVGSRATKSCFREAGALFFSHATSHAHFRGPHSTLKHERSNRTTTLPARRRTGRARTPKIIPKKIMIMLET
jgi:hypothetical protein